MGEKGKGVANVKRQTWDKEEFERLAQLRASGQIQDDEKEKKVIKSHRQEFKAAVEGAAGPAGSARAFLTSRSERVTLEEKVGTVRVIKGDDAVRANGYFCEVCECTLKDSIAYLDHINGKRHLQKLGYSMRVERSSVDDVKSRFQSAAKRKYEPLVTKKMDAMEEYEKKKRELEEEEARRKRQRKEARKARKQETDAPATDDGEDEHAKNDGSEDVQESKETEAKTNETDTPSVEQTEEEAMMAMMGFGGFGSTKNN